MHKFKHKLLATFLGVRYQRLWRGHVAKAVAGRVFAERGAIAKETLRFSRSSLFV
jgi:hypothetical protein